MAFSAFRSHLDSSKQHRTFRSFLAGALRSLFFPPSRRFHPLLTGISYHSINEMARIRCIILRDFRPQFSNRTTTWTLGTRYVLPTFMPTIFPSRSSLYPVFLLMLKAEHISSIFIISGESLSITLYASFPDIFIYMPPIYFIYPLVKPAASLCGYIYPLLLRWILESCPYSPFHDL